ncbi:asparagine synthetase B [Marinitoga sp. 1154]|uniref:asparagine synthetase B family protein n=1 Tax=Marinitoga sp. 1154 TaxID=1643335 RepID=UPI0015869915|nr:hypothetical protein [Marinitoga sp. 1154]
MCGINGFFQFGNKAKLEKEQIKNVIKTMNDKIIHRGPDEEGIYVNNNIGLGMRRLSIIDLSEGSQPIYNEDKTLVIVFNGEIYNFLELRDLLISKGHIFKTHSDTEVIIHSYEEFGVDCVNYFDGMFSFAIYDIKNKKLFIARDRIGEKPLYYFKNDDFIIFGSELKSLISTGLIKKEISM